jgi:hypothetical protein
MMGDLVLLQEEVNAVMSSLLENGIEVSALHNHFFWEEPRLFYMHVGGVGKPVDLARRVKPCLDLIGHARTGMPDQPSSGKSASDKAAGSPPSPQGTLNTSRLAGIVGREGEMSGPVYKITLGRPDIKLECMGARIGPRMGLNSWAAFFGSDDSAVIAGDIAMLENEVMPVLKALRSHGLEVVAIHHHMINVRPVIIFLHYWGKGSAAELASGFRTALDVLGQKKAL